MSVLKKCVISGFLQPFFVIAFSVVLLASPPLSSAQSSQPVINCSGFAASGVCGVSLDGYSSNAFIVTHSPTATMSGSQVDLIPSGSVHYGSGMIYQTPVNVQAFSSTFTFVPNGWNLAFVLQNNTNTAASPPGPLFGAGAGCEAGFYQIFDSTSTPPNNIFALELDQQSDLVDDNGAGYGSPFTYSSVQIYKAGQSPCNPNDNQPDYYYTQKISTSPVPLNSPANSVGTTTGDTYSVTLNYDGSNLVMNMYDVTAGGSCPGSSCFTQTWGGVNIPALVGGNTAYLGFTGGTNSASNYPLYVNSLAYGASSSSSSNPSPSINYGNGGFQASSFDLNGGAAVTSDGLLQLTDGARWEARSAWFASQVPVQSFTTDFTFQQLNPAADGMTFTIQGQSPAALGRMGGSLGYGDITNSVAVKFDLHNDNGEGNDSTGLYTDGAKPTVPSIDLSSTPINLQSGDVMDAHMVYDGTELTMTLTDTVTGGSVTEVFPVNIPSLVGGNTAYVGFTGGTGYDTATQEVLSWTFSNP